MTVLKFLQTYWREILAIISVVASLVIFLVKKKPSINEMSDILLRILEKLPEFIIQAECLEGAEAKKALVLECVKRFVKDQFSIILPDAYMSFIGQCIEAILSTPQKHLEEK